MKKVLLVLSLLVSGCVDVRSLEFRENYTSLKRSGYEEIVTMEQLINNIRLTLNQGKNEYWFYSEVDFSLDELVKKLSFLFPFDMKIRKMKKGGGIQVIRVECLDENYQDAVVEAKRLLSFMVNDGMTNGEKIDVVYRYIIENCRYDVSVKQRTKENERAFQCAGVLFDGNAVCTGYARTLLLFMNLLKIPCLYISSDVMNHSFNLVYDGKMRYLDSTWDDLGYRYYECDKESFFADGKHVFDLCYDDEFFEWFLRSIYL